MKKFRALLVTCLALASGNALASSPTEITRFDCKLKESSRPAGGAKTVVLASPEVVKSVVLDFKNYASYFNPDSKDRDAWKSNVVGRSGDKTDLYLQVPILKGAAKIWAIIRFDPPVKEGNDQVVHGRMIKGNVEQLSAKWTLKPAPDNKTELQLEFLVVPKIYVPDGILAGEARSAAAKAVSGMNREALKRASSG
jgi:hypothetical protein